MLFSPPTREQTLALAGVFQACSLVDELARLGTCDQQAFAVSIHSLFEQNPVSTEAVFGSAANLEQGFNAMEKVLGAGRGSQQPEFLRYVLGVLYLQKKVTGNKPILHKIGNGLENAAAQAEHFSETHPNVLSNLADLYQRTISTFNFRIQVSGTADTLRQPVVAEKIRCLLFAAVRAAILWQQVGGKRRHLIFNRNGLLEAVRALRRET